MALDQVKGEGWSEDNEELADALVAFAQLWVKKEEEKEEEKKEEKI